METSANERPSIPFRAAVIFAILVMVIHLSLATYRPSLGAPINLLASTITSGLATLGLFYGAFRSKGYPISVLIAWSVLTLGQLSQTLGGFISILTEINIRPIHFPWLSSLFFSLFCLSFTIGILVLLSFLFKSSERTKLLLDVGIILIGSILVAWAFVFRSRFSDMNLLPGPDSTAALFLLIRDTAELILFVTMLMFALIQPHSLMPGSSMLLIAGIGVEILMDGLTNYLTGSGISLIGNFSALGYTLAYVLIGLAGVSHATVPRSRAGWMDGTQQRRYDIGHWSNYTPFLWVVVGYGVLIWDYHYELPIPRTMLEWGMGGIILFVVIRQTLMLRENALFQISIDKEMTERTRVDQALRESEQRYRYIAENASDLIWAMDLNLRITYVSPSVIRQRGVSVEESIMLTPADFLTPASFETAIRFFSDMVKEAETFPPDQLTFESRMLESEIIRKDGSTFWVESAMKWLLDAGGKPIGILGVSRDITQRRAMEQALRDSESRLRRITDNMQDVITEIDLEGKIRYASPSHSWVLGYDIEQLIGQSVLDHMHPEDVQEAMTVLFKTVNERANPEPVIFRYRHVDGHYLWMECVGNPITDARGQVTGIVLSSRDATRRKEAEEALQKLNEGLEERIEARTEELTRVNIGLQMEIAERQRVEEALRQSERKYRLHFENVLDVIFSYDRELKIVDVSPSVERILGYRPDELLGKAISELDILSPYYSELVLSDVQQILSGERKTGEYEFIAKDGSRKFGEVTGSPMHSEDGQIIGVVSVARDITERKQMENALRRSEERYALAARGANDGLWDWNLKNNTVYYSSRWKAMFGIPAEECEDNPREWFSRVHPDDIDPLNAAIASHLRNDRPDLNCEFRMRHADGSYLWILCRGLALRDPVGTPYRIAGSLTDITSRKHAEERLVHDAMHDSLTGLPNRALFLDRLSGALERARRHQGRRFAVLFLDLDRFKVVNDSLGHVTGDEMLVEVAHRLSACIRSQDTIARLGGDEFAFLLEEVGHIGIANQIATRAQSALADPIQLKGQEVYTTASIGIAFYHPSYRRPEEILRDADIAMYKAKSLGRACNYIFDSESHPQAVALLQLETDLRRGLERNELRVHYQPLISLAQNRVIGFEALVRWQHPSKGLLSPAEFLDVAEDTGLIVPIGRWVLNEACHEAVRWIDRFASGRNLTVSVNLSSRQFSQPDLPAHVQQALVESKLDPSRLILEMTESVIIGNTEVAEETLKRLNDLGVKVALDDFGTGYSSLSYLLRLPISMIKIDRSFVSTLGAGQQQAALVRWIITLCRRLKIGVVAEGVETRRQDSVLRKMGCRFGQGYLYSVPIEAEAIDILPGGLVSHIRSYKKGRAAPSAEQKPRGARHRVK